jgi:hypothetical protein
MSQVKTAGEAISVLVQVAELAQAKGILSLDDAVVTKSAIDFLRELANPSEPVQEEVENGPH